MVDRCLQYPRVAFAVRLCALWLGACSYIISLKHAQRAYAAVVREIVDRLNDPGEADGHDDRKAFKEHHAPLSAEMPAQPLADVRVLFALPVDVPLEPRLDRRNKRLYQQLARRMAVAPPAIDPITSPAAIAAHRPIVGALFDRLLGLRLDDRALDVVSRYGNASTALCDFLRHCGYASRLPIGRVREGDVEAFVVFADWRHQRFASGDHQAEAAFKSLTASWARAKAVYHDRRGEDALQNEWLNLRASVYRSSVRRRLEQQIAFDAAMQQCVADRLTFDLYTRAFTCVTQAAAVAYNRSCSSVVANRHTQTLTAGLEHLRLALTEALHRNDRVHL